MAEASSWRVWIISHPACRQERREGEEGAHLAQGLRLSPLIWMRTVEVVVAHDGIKVGFGSYGAGRRLVVVIPIASEEMGWWRSSRQCWGGGCWKNSGEKEGRVNCRKIKGLFFANFSPDFFHAQGMETTPIYRSWKRDILSLIMSHLGLWFSPKGSHPLGQSGYHELSNLAVESCLSWHL